MGNRKTWSTEPEDGETNCRTLRGGCREGGAGGVGGAGGRERREREGQILFFHFCTENKRLLPHTVLQTRFTALDGVKGDTR